MEPRPLALTLFGVRREVRSWTHGLEIVIHEMRDRHPAGWREVMLSLPRWNGCRGNSRLVMDMDSDSERYPDQFPVYPAGTIEIVPRIPGRRSDVGSAECSVRVRLPQEHERDNLGIVKRILLATAIIIAVACGGSNEPDIPDLPWESFCGAEYGIPCRD